MTPARKYGPWRCRQRPVGDWVVDQLDRQKMQVRRYGPYETEQAARAMLAYLVNNFPPPTRSFSGQDPGLFIRVGGGNSELT